jgi:osmoprotectant transport system permease protein
MPEFGRSILAKPVFWLTLVFLVLLLAMPHFSPLFALIFPEDPRPVYSRASFVELALAHVQLVVVSTVLSAAIGLGAGIFVTRDSGREFLSLVSALAATGQVFPPIAVLALAIPSLGFGAAPTLAALTLYAILPILGATITGIDAVPRYVIDAAQGMGFSKLAILRQIELQLALPFILAGLQNAVMISIGTATIGSSIGALSLGSPILEGLSANNPAYVIEGAILVALLAIVTNGWFEVLEKSLTSPAQGR